MISGYVDDGDKPDKELKLLPGAAEETLAFLKEHPESHKRFERVADLVEGFESSFGLELLATVHWLVDNDESIKNKQGLANRMYNWNDAKQQFTLLHSSSPPPPNTTSSAGARMLYSLLITRP